MVSSSSGGGVGAGAAGAQAGPMISSTSEGVQPMNGTVTNPGAVVRTISMAEVLMVVVDLKTIGLNRNLGSRSTTGSLMAEFSWSTGIETRLYV